MYFGPSISVGRRGVSYGDSDAQAFIAATGLTGTTEVNAVNNLVANLKQYGLWSKMKAIYPFVSDTNNLLSYTEDFSNAAWQKANASITANTTIAPDGTTTADTITDNSTSGLHQVQFPLTTTIGAYTISCYAKAGTLSYIGLFNNSSNQGKLFNLSNGTTAGNIVAAPTSTTIQSVGNGWYRFSITTTTLGSNSNWQILLSEDGVTFSYSGTGKNAYIWGAQLDAGTTATTYQPIATTPANRFVSQFKYNLKDARDLDAAFRLAFNGTWTYSKQGATPSGTNAFANTYVNPTNVGFTQTNTHLSAYLKTDSNGSKIDIGGSYNLFMGVRWANNYNFPINRSNNAVGTSANSIGYFLASRVDNVRDRMFKNGTNVTNFTGAAVSLDNQNIYIGAASAAGPLYSDRQTAFNTIGDGLTDTEATNLYTSVQLFQQELSRYVGVPIVSDANAQAFLDAAVITDQTQANAVNTLVTDLKTYGLWTKMKAIYPFVGGTATTHKWNLKDPRDLDAAYRLAFSGAWTHSSTGALPNGANAYADTFLNMLSVLTNNNNHMSFYSRTNSTAGNKVDIGITDNTTHSNQLSANWNGNTLFENGNQVITAAYGTSLGHYIGTSTSVNSAKLYKNGSVLGSSSTTNTYALFNNKMYLGATNVSSTNTPTYYSDKQQAFASIGDGLSDTEAANLYTAVNKFQTSLSRNV